MAEANDNRIRTLPPLNLPRVDNPPVVLPAPEEKPKPAPPPAPVKAGPPADRAIRENAAYTVLAWTARIVVGVCMISNIFPLSFVTAIAAFGWLQRRMQAITLRGWWRESPRRLEGTFQDFCDSLGDDAPVERPRWFWRERILQHLSRPGKNGMLVHGIGTLFSLATLPVHSLWVNFRVGIAGLLATYMLTGWGCMIMLFSWYFGWLNSFHKGYEDAFLGLTAGLFGSLLLIFALMYVPMAQAHQAATGEISAFFQFRVVTRLILTRFTAYTILIGGLGLTSLIFEIPRLFTLGENFGPNRAETAREAFWMLEGYWFLCSIFFFLSLLVLRTLSALIYRSAMLKAIRNGTVHLDELPGTLQVWFQKLEIYPQAQVPKSLISSALRATISFKYRAFLLAAVFLIWLLFVMRFYAGYFFVFHEYRGILNHPVVQVPCIDWTPWHLVAGLDE
jgi:hypothetical protein